ERRAAHRAHRLGGPQTGHMILERHVLHYRGRQFRQPTSKMTLTIAGVSLLFCSQNLRSQSLSTVLQLHADATEVGSVTNGSTVTPTITPPGFVGKVVLTGSGSVNFAPAQVGNGTYFLNCCGILNTAYYKFTGATVGNIFNVNQGQISFYLKSRYSFSNR